MIFPSNFEQKLGFDSIRRKLEELCLSVPGKKKIAAIACADDPQEITARLGEADEMKHIILFAGGFPSQDYFDLTGELIRIRIPGTFIEPEQLSELKLSLITIAEQIRFVRQSPAQYPCLNTIAENSNPDFFLSITRLIADIIDEKSEVRESASPELHRIRRKKSALIASVERQTVQQFKLARQQGWTPDEAEITIRNGRLVIPVTSTHKRKITGFVHDESATGHTIYIEPAESFETNNIIRELEYEERREIIRILTAFADRVRPDIELLLHGYQVMGTFDAVRAKALFAISIGGVKPLHLPAPGDQIKPPSFFWNQAIHPLLYLSHLKQKKQVIPLNIRLNQNERILVISGPNAGGKSVCLKTTGLIQYMFQCGLLPPVREDSEFCLFRNIFIDIGDEQSIDNDLSTYSSKLLNLKFFIENVDQRTLFLIDEFGTGTDPTLGGAIAEATLEALNAREGMGVVTTHYSNLKLMAGREHGIINGAMLFDLRKLKPLYQLKIGHPGSSFALEIAREIGFPENVLDRAGEMTGASQLDFDRELQGLEVEKRDLQKRQQEVTMADEFLAEVIAKYEKLTEDLEHRKKEILDKARTEAADLLEKVNSTIERTIRDIKESQAEKARTKEARKAIEEIKQEVQNVVPPAATIAATIPDNAAPVTGRYSEYVKELNTRLNHYTLTLDLRGKRADEAVSMLQRYIDDAIMFAIPEVRILHGKGNGILRQITRDYLRGQKEVKSARDAPLDQGGAGITMVSFRK